MPGRDGVLPQSEKEEHTPTLRRIVRYAWAATASAVGLLLAAVLAPFGARARTHDGVLEVAVAETPASTRLSRAVHTLPFRAITFGHVVIGATPADLDRLRAHEQAHVRQYEHWGPLLFVAYPVASLIQLARGRPGYRDNHFEVEARRVASEEIRVATEDGA